MKPKHKKKPRFRTEMGAFLDILVEVTGFEHMNEAKNCLKYNVFTIH